MSDNSSGIISVMTVTVLIGLGIYMILETRNAIDGKERTIAKNQETIQNKSTEIHHLQDRIKGLTGESKEDKALIAELKKQIQELNTAIDRLRQEDRILRDSIAAITNSPSQQPSVVLQELRTLNTIFDNNYRVSQDLGIRKIDRDRANRSARLVADSIINIIHAAQFPASEQNEALSIQNKIDAFLRIP